MQGQRDTGQLAGRVGMRDRTAECAAVADLGVADVGHCFDDQRGFFQYDRAVFNHAVAGHGADRKAACLGGLDVVEFVNGIQIDQGSRPCHRKFMAGIRL